MCTTRQNKHVHTRKYQYTLPQLISCKLCMLCDEYWQHQRGSFKPDSSVLYTVASEVSEGITNAANSHARAGQSTEGRLSSRTWSLCLVPTSCTEFDVKGSDAQLLHVLGSKNKIRSRNCWTYLGLNTNPPPLPRH